MDELARKVAFLEARLTLLERKLAHAPLNPDAASAAGQAGANEPRLVRLACDSPGLMISRMYSVERDEDGDVFCWVGNEGPIQFVLPVQPIRAARCRLRLRPHPAVDFSGVSVLVNDEERGAEVDRDAGQERRRIEVVFDVPSSAAPQINVLLLGVESVRPSDHGENSDDRLLAARFFGVELLFS